MLVATLLILSSATNFSKYHSTHKLRIQKVHSYKNAFCVEFFWQNIFCSLSLVKRFYPNRCQWSAKNKAPHSLTQRYQNKIVSLMLVLLFQCSKNLKLMSLGIPSNWIGTSVDCANTIVPLNSWKIVPSVWADYFLNIGC